MTIVEFTGFSRHRKGRSAFCVVEAVWTSILMSVLEQLPDTEHDWFSNVWFEAWPRSHFTPDLGRLRLFEDRAEHPQGGGP